MRHGFEGTDPDGTWIPWCRGTDGDFSPDALQTSRATAPKNSTTFLGTNTHYLTTLHTVPPTYPIGLGRRSTPNDRYSWDKPHPLGYIETPDFGDGPVPILGPDTRP